METWHQQYFFPIIDGILHWLDGYLALFTIASVNPLLPELENDHEVDII